MPVVTILKRKGGVGSSTIAANLAGQFMARGRSVVLLDADAQHSSAVWAGFAEEGEEGCLSRVVRTVETDSPRKFREMLEQAQEAADVVIVDTAAGFQVTSLEAARHADVVLIPCGPSPLDMAPAGDALEVADSCRDGRDRPVICFVPSKNLPRTRLGRELPAALAELGQTASAAVLPSISQRIAVAESVLCGLTVNEYEPDGAAAKEFAALADAVEVLL